MIGTACLRTLNAATFVPFSMVWTGGLRHLSNVLTSHVANLGVEIPLIKTNTFALSKIHTSSLLGLDK